MPAATGDPLRIGLVTPGFPPRIGGVEMVSGRVAEGLAGRGHRVTVLAHAGPPGDRGGTPVDPPGVEVRLFRSFLEGTPFPLSPELWIRLRSCQSEWDVVNAHSFHASLGLVTSFLTKRPLVFTPHYHGAGHTPAAALAHRLYDPMAGRIFDVAASVICVSEAEASLLSRDYPRAAAKVEIVPNGVDVAEIVAAPPFEEEPPTILHVGRLERYKQVELLLRAMAMVKAPARLVVIGDGSDATRLRAIADELGLGSRVHFAGRRPDLDVRRWQRTAAAAVCLSTHEAFGLAVVEAAVAGARVVASDIPAHREVARRVQGKVDLVGTEAAPGELAELLEALLSVGRGDPLEDTSDLGWDVCVRRTEACLRKASA